MTTLPDLQVLVTFGVDTHADNHVAAALDQMGGQLGTPHAHVALDRAGIVANRVPTCPRCGPSIGSYADPPSGLTAVLRMLPYRGSLWMRTNGGWLDAAQSTRAVRLRGTYREGPGGV